MNLVSEDVMDSPWSVALEDDPDPALRQSILAPLIAYLRHSHISFHGRTD